VRTHNDEVTEVAPAPRSEWDSAHESLVASEMRLRSLMEIAEIGCWEYDIETGKNRWDSALKRLMGARDPDNHDGRSDRPTTFSISRQIVFWLPI